jgi:hypothetical protein
MQRLLDQLLDDVGRPQVCERYDAIDEVEGGCAEYQRRECGREHHPAGANGSTDAEEAWFGHRSHDATAGKELGARERTAGRPAVADVHDDRDVSRGKNRVEQRIEAVQPIRVAAVRVDDHRAAVWSALRALV